MTIFVEWVKCYSLNNSALFVYCWYCVRCVRLPFRCHNRYHMYRQHFPNLPLCIVRYKWQIWYMESILYCTKILELEIRREMVPELVIKLLLDSAIYKIDFGRTVYKYGLTLITAWIRNHMPSKVWDEINNAFPNFDGATVEVWEWINNFHPTHYNEFKYLSVLRVKLIQRNEKGHWSTDTSWKCLIPQYCIKEKIENFSRNVAAVGLSPPISC